jgi:peptidoglycan/LPS O-acetylase OafA/YrhL
VQWRCVDDLFHTWSLAVEEHFYLVWPAVLVACVVRGRERWLPWIAGAGLVGSLVALAVMPHFGITNVAFRPDARGGGLLIGCLVALVLRRRPVMLRPWLAWVALAAVLLLFLAGRTASLDTAEARTLIPITWAAAAVMVAELAVNTDRAFARVLSWRPLAYIGLISYGLYLYHMLIFRAVGHWLNLSRTPESSIAIALSLAVAAASYRWLESPFLRVKKRYASEGGLDEKAAPPRPGAETGRCEVACADDLAAGEARAVAAAALPNLSGARRARPAVLLGRMRPRRRRAASQRLLGRAANCRSQPEQQPADTDKRLRDELRLRGREHGAVRVGRQPRLELADVGLDVRLDGGLIRSRGRC